MSPSKLTKYCACHAKWPSNIWQKFAKNSWNVISNARPIRDRSENDPNMIRSGSVSPQPATQQRLLFALRTNGLYWKIQHFALRLSFQISPSTAPTTKSNTSTSPSTAPTTKSDTWTSPSTAPTTQSDTWTSPSPAPTTQSDTWTSPSTAPTTKSDTWPSPSTAPATQNDSQAWSSSHMKRHFQCAEKQMSPSKLTKYCACHAKWPSNIWQKFAKNSWNVISNARPIRDRSENDPIRFRQSATRHATEVTFRAPEERFVLKNTTFHAPAIFPNLTKYCACHEKWHLNFTKYCAYHEKWHLNFTKYCAYHAKWHLNFTKYCAYHAKWHLNFTKYCAYHAKWHLTFTKYCAYHEKWHLTLCYIKPKWIEIKAKWIPFSCGGGNVLDHIIVIVAVQKILTAPKLQLLVVVAMF